MGNKPNNVKPLSKNQALQAFSSGVSNSSKSNAGQVLSIIRISLVQINLPLLSKISIGDKVIVRWKDSAFYCFFKNTQLGKIPANYNNKFVQSLSYTSSVFSFREHPPAVTIEISL